MKDTIIKLFFAGIIGGITWNMKQVYEVNLKMRDEIHSIKEQCVEKEKNVNAKFDKLVNLLKIDIEKLKNGINSNKINIDNLSSKIANRNVGQTRVKVFREAAKPEKDIKIDLQRYKF